MYVRKEKRKKSAPRSTVPTAVTILTINEKKEKRKKYTAVHSANGSHHLDTHQHVLDVAVRVLLHPRRARCNPAPCS
jgi:hypothetical protein